MSSPFAVHGLVLAAGAGTRMGVPKALVHDVDGTAWVERAVRVLLDGGCKQVTVVLGADAERARPLVPSAASVVIADDWESGLSASLAAGLNAIHESDGPDGVEGDSVGPDRVVAALVHLVDLPDVTASVAHRLLEVGVTSDVLARASYQGVPGHPVLIGRDHFAALTDQLVGDLGARTYLQQHDVQAVDCSDLATGEDVDHR